MIKISSMTLMFKNEPKNDLITNCCCVVLIRLYNIQFLDKNINYQSQINVSH